MSDQALVATLISSMLNLLAVAAIWRYNSLVQGKCPPKGDELDSLVIVTGPVGVEAMEAHFNGKSHTLTGKVSTFRISTTAGLPNGHDTDGLDGSELLGVGLLPVQPLGLVEKSIAGGKGIFRIPPHLRAV